MKSSVVSKNLTLSAICTALTLWGASDHARAADGIVSSGIDSTASVVINTKSDGLGGNTPGLFAVVVGTDYNGYSGNVDDIDLNNPGSVRNRRFLFGELPGMQAQFQVNTDSVQMNRNTFIANEGTFGVSGATTLNSTLGVAGAATLSSSLDVTGASTLRSTLGVSGATTLSSTLGVSGATTLSRTLGVSGATTLSSTLGVAGAATLSSTLGVAGATTLGSTLGVAGATTLSSTLDVTGVSTLGRSTIAGATGNAATVLKGGTNSGILTLQDGNTAAAGTTPAGTSITISGSGGGTAATVFQATTNANTTSVTTTVGTNASYAGGSTAALQAGPANAVTVNSGNAGATPGVSINGVVGTGSNSTTGVRITGSGQNSQSYTTADRSNGVIPTWADVAIQSKSYGLGDPTLGGAILLTDYGIQMISPQPIVGQQATNNAGINNSTGNIVNNNGMNTSSGSVLNNTGGNSGSGSAVNNLGMNSSTSGGTVANHIGGISGNGAVANTIGQNNGTGIATNGFGTGTGVTNNFIGNNNSGSTVQLDGGSSRMTLNGNGATFSNPSTGGPIQLHGVADGSSPHDAVNVRQLFGGVAASMATAPTVTNLKPGDAGVGVGFGHYGGYSAMGINMTYYARNEAQLNLGIARSMQSGGQTGIRASVGFKF
jgi:hypothetical protein